MEDVQRDRVRSDILVRKVCGGGGRDEGVQVRSGHLRVVKLEAHPSEKTGTAKDGEWTSISRHLTSPWANFPVPGGHQERHLQTMAHKGRL